MSCAQEPLSPGSPTQIELTKAPKGWRKKECRGNEYKKEERKRRERQRNEQGIGRGEED